MKDNFQEDMQIISKNIRLLRDFWGDTRPCLAEELTNNNYPVAKDTIKSYENGDRDIPDEYIEAIAKMYNISSRLIKEQTLTLELLESYYAQVNLRNLTQTYDFIFYNAAVTDDSTENEGFIRAITYLKALVNFDFENAVSPTEIRELFYTAFIDEKNLAGASNTLMMLFVEYAQFNFDLTYFQKAVKGGLTNGQLYEKYRDIWTDITPEKKSFIVETQDVFDKCIKALAQNGARIYAEYYMALKYFLCMIDNGRSYRENLEIGLVMMNELKKIDNKLAIAFIDKLDKNKDLFD